MAHKRSVLCRIAFGLLAFTTQVMCYGGGVTLITHGWHGDTVPKGWVDSMAAQVANRTSNPNGVTRIRVSITALSLGGPLAADVEVTSGPVPTDSSASDEIIISLDWSTVSGTIVEGTPYYRTQDIAAEAADLFFNPSFELAFVFFGGPLAERPIHLIGHSRGGSVVTEIARILGESGVWVDQVTTLDPHPVGVPFQDATVKLRENVIFADNYYRADSIFIPADFDGEPVTFASNFRLDETLLDKSGGYFFAHQNVHLWYHGTIDTSAGAQADKLDVPTEWYGGKNPGRLDSGFCFSRIAGGTADRPPRGLHPLHGGFPGPMANRYVSQRQGAQWANIDDLRVTSAPFGLIKIGDPMTVTYRYQDYDSGATIEWYLDNDTNPYNGSPERFLATQVVGVTGKDIGSGTLTRATGDVPEGIYYLYAKITSDNGGYTRYAYAPGVLSFSSSFTPPPTPVISLVDPDNLPGLPLPETQPIVITGTGFIPESRLEFFDGTTTYPNRTPIYDSSTQLRYNIKVGNISSDWTVEVVNGSVKSDPAPFHVTATADSTAPPAPTDVTFEFAGGVNDDFYYVDWANPNDDSGLAKVWWKLGSPPTSPSDGVGFALPDLKPLPVATLTTEPQTLYLWLEDGAGNKDYSQYASVMLYRTTGSPLVLTQPADRSVPEGASASFSVSANGAPPLAYQWQRSNDAGNSFNDIPGATGPTYATPALTLADSGAQFRVRVTNAFGSALSGPATLTVNTANVITWTGAAGDGNWFNRTNWNPMSVPTASHTAVINSGNVSVPADASFGVLNLNGGTLSGSVTIMDTLNWTGGQCSYCKVTVAPGGVLNITGDSDKYLQYGCAITNRGTINWSGSGNLWWYGDSMLDNGSGAVFNMASDANLSTVNYTGAALVFNNAGTVRKSAGTGTNALQSVAFSNRGTVDVQSATLSFAYSITDSGGVFNAGAGTTLRLNGGVFDLNTRFTGSGSVRLAGTYTGTLNGQNFNCIEGPLSGTITLSGTLNWVGGVWDYCKLTVAPGGVLNVTGGTDKYLQYGCAITNRGTIKWSGDGNLWWYGDSMLDNGPGAVFDMGSDANLSTVNYTGAALVFTNAGTVRKSGGTGTNTIQSVAFSSTGSVEVQSGTLSFAYFITGSGCVFDAAAGATLSLSGGGFDASTRFTGSGPVRMTGTYTGTLSGQNFNCVEGTLGGTITLNGTLNWSGGVWNYCKVTVAPGGVLNITGDTDKALRRGCAITNLGNLRWSGAGNLWGYEGDSVLDNQPGALFDMEGDTVIGARPYEGLIFITNAGTVRKSGGIGTNIFQRVNFANTGTLEVQSGMLHFDSSISSVGGIFNTAPGAVLSLSAGSFDPNTRFVGPGLVLLNGWTPPYTAGPYSGTLDGVNFQFREKRMSGTLTLKGTLNWTGGDWETCKVTVAPGGVLNITGDTDKALRRGCAITNLGNLRWSGAGNLWGYEGDSVLDNQPGALFDMEGDTVIGARPYEGLIFITNAGTVRKSGGTGTNVFERVSFSNTGTVEVQSGTLSSDNFIQTAGLTRLVGGSLSGGTLNFTGGTLSGSGIINASVVNEAVVSPGSSPGTLTINGDYTQTDAGVLQMELGGPSSTESDRLVVKGSATLGGTLNVSLLDGYQPGAGSTFEVLDFGSRHGVFSSLELGNPTGDVALVPSYGATALVLATQGIPSIVWADPADAVYGTALDPRELDATALFNGQEVAGTFAYEPPAGTVLPAGPSRRLTAAFTPANPTAFKSPALAEVHLNVAQAPLTVTANSTNRTYGAANPVFGAKLTDFVNGDTAAVVSGQAEVTTTATAASPVAKYDLVPAVGTLSAANYIFANFVKGALTVTAAPLTVAGVVAVTKVYDGTTSATVNTTGATLNGVLPADAGNVSLGTSEATGGFADKNVGTGKPVAASGLSLSGNAAGNYTLTPPTLTANITSATLTVSSLVASNKVYNGTTTAAVTGTPALAGVIGSDSVSLSGTATGIFADKAVANNKPVTVTGLSLVGADAGNYTLSVPGLSASITPAALTVTADDKVRVFGTANPSLTGTMTGLQAGDAIRANYNCSATIADPAGPYPIVPSLVDADGNLANYEVTLNNGTLTVLPLELKLGELAFTGSRFGLSIATEPGLKYTLEYTLSLTAPVWTPVQTAIGDGNAMSLDDANATDSARFYRVRVEP